MTQHIIKDWRSAVAKLKNRVVALEKGGVGGGTPGGSDTQVQFNDSGAFGGDAGFTYNKTTDILSLTGGLTLGTTPATAGMIRIPNGQLIGWRNSGDTGNDTLGLVGNSLVFSGTSGGYLQAVYVKATGYVAAKRIET